MSKSIWKNVKYMKQYLKCLIFYSCTFFKKLNITFLKIVAYSDLNEILK